MRLVAYDPFVAPPSGPASWASSCSRSTSSSAEADFLTIHLPKTKETVGLIGRDLLRQGQARRCASINVARGGIVDEDALAEAIRDGPHRRRRARRVRRRADHGVAAVRARLRSSSPRTSGASTREAQDKAGDTIAEHGAARPRRRVRAVRRQRRRRRGQRDRAAVPAARRAARAGCSPRSPAAARRRSRSPTRASSPSYDTRILTLVGAEGLLRRRQRRAGHLRQRAAAGRGARASRCARSTTSTHASTTSTSSPSRGGGHASPARWSAVAASSASCMIDDHTVDVPPADHMLVVRNDDRPGRDRHGRHAASATPA